MIGVAESTGSAAGTGSGRDASEVYSLGSDLLAERASPGGQVVGLDADAVLAAWAAEFAAEFAAERGQVC